MPSPKNQQTNISSVQEGHLVEDQMSAKNIADAPNPTNTNTNHFPLQTTGLIKKIRSLIGNVQEGESI
jgi:hypothetical protein